MKKSFVILINLGYWLLYLLLLAVVFAAVTVQIREKLSWFSLFPIIFLYLAPNIVAFYISYFLLFPKFLFRKKIAALIVFGIAACVISAFSVSFISVFFYGFDQPVFRDLREFAGFFFFLTLIAAVHAGIALVIRGFIQWFDEIKLKEEFAAKNYEMESALIKSQINPHFLFNTINNIDFLIAKDAPKASEYLNKLSDILRYMVYDTKNEKIALSKELDYIRKYLELQKIRTVNPDYINFEVGGEAESLTVAPMIFFPFIENAFKHTENNKQTNKIRIEISVEAGKIVFECENSYQKTADNHAYGGVGNELIERRLMILYPAKHSLETTNEDGIYKVKLTLNEN
ncbi:MAG: sensor histidine kinase [Pyrinomonadaceae bacterium]|nr:sensor histidine kinase [Pyrinomonadaceae bacterium]